MSFLFDLFIKHGLLKVEASMSNVKCTTILMSKNGLTNNSPVLEYSLRSLTVQLTLSYTQYTQYICSTQLSPLMANQ